MSDKKLPRPEDVQKEFEDFIKHRFGGNVQVFSSHMQPPESSPDSEPDSEPKAEESDSIFDFNLKPKQVKEYLDQFVIKQNEAKKAISIAVCDHYNQVKRCLKNPEASTEDYSKQNVLILGPTGVGKTYLIRKVAELIGVPFVKADATRFSETGYVGANVDDLVRDLVQQADGDIEKAQYGIVYLDEADKLASPSTSLGRDVNGRGVQFGLLRLMEETEVDLRSGNDIQSQMQAIMDMQRGGKASKSKVNTKNILFIVSGAFTGLEDHIKKRLQTNQIGFTGTSSSKKDLGENVFPHATTEDFIEFGFEPEFIGRLPIRVSCASLQEDDLYQILDESQGSIIHQYRRAFEAYGIKIDFSEKGLRKIAARAFTERTGARALMTVCEKALRDFKFELPTSHISEFIVCAETIENPEQALANVLSQPDMRDHLKLEKEIDQFEEMFKDNYGMAIKFDDDARRVLVTRAKEENRSMINICNDVLMSYEHGLKLIMQNSGKTSFTLPAETVNNPRAHLERLIKESYADV